MRFSKSTDTLFGNQFDFSHCLWHALQTAFQDAENLARWNRHRKRGKVIAVHAHLSPNNEPEGLLVELMTVFDMSDFKFIKAFPYGLCGITSKMVVPFSGEVGDNLGDLWAITNSIVDQVYSLNQQKVSNYLTEAIAQRLA